MNSLFFPKLAAGNLRKNAKIYFPFMLTCLLTVAMFYIVCSLAGNSSLSTFSGSLSQLLSLAAWVTAIFTVIFLFYTNSFLMKRRKKELGLYNILGMDKKHIALTILWETLLIAFLTVFPGLAAGILLDKLMYLALMKILGGLAVFGFEISISSLLAVFKLFAAIFILILADSLRQVYFSKPIELLKGGQTGEKEPKSKWILALLGLLSLSAGYYMAITAKNPVTAYNRFFIAVLLVLAGTYLLFTAGSIVLLKILRSHKAYYYQTRHFISVSGMMYRMKQNAAGLSNICLLSTAVLIMISTTLSLYAGMEHSLQTRYPHSIMIDVQADTEKQADAEKQTDTEQQTESNVQSILSAKGVTAQNDANFSSPADAQTDADKQADAEKQLESTVQGILSAKGVTAQNETRFSYLAFGTIEDEGRFVRLPEDRPDMSLLDRYYNMVLLPLSDYNRMTGLSETLDEKETLLYSNHGTAYKGESIQILGETFSIKEKLDTIASGDILGADIAVTHYLVVRDMAVAEKMQGLLEMSAPISYRYAFDLDADSETVLDTQALIQQALADKDISFTIDGLDDARQDFLGIYGGLFFVGIFLGILFIMAAVLIIYYKQINEGYNDQERFVIMKKVGLSRAEIKRTIRSQILTVFFLPLIMAGIHVAAAFPALTQLLSMLGLANISLFALCVLGSFAVFSLFYALVYALTARTYYQIVG